MHQDDGIKLGGFQKAAPAVSVQPLVLGVVMQDQPADVSQLLTMPVLKPDLAIQYQLLVHVPDTTVLHQLRVKKP
ncbi:hypothetical protein GCM10023183_04710 [Nibribacter koreensis]|uniref:Uncharacterized protein n=2 Tax=Nibribacter koreensis TaxID=1084519 RepID=A0ABP8F814_9BACT